jgi:hypothetical protein
MALFELRIFLVNAACFQIYADFHEISKEFLKVKYMYCKVNKESNLQTVYTINVNYQNVVKISQDPRSITHGF